MALLRLPRGLVRLQGIALGYPYLFALDNDQPKIRITDNETNEDIWTDLTHMGVDTTRTANVAEHPIETGSVVMDHRVVNPTEVTLRLVATKNNYREMYSSIQSYYRNSYLVKIHTRTRVNRNMAIVSFPDYQDPELFDALSMEVTFREMLFVTPSQGTMTQENTRESADSNTVQQGQKSPNGTITVVNENAQQEALEKRIKGGGKR
jgi:hypothetical protein